MFCLPVEQVNQYTVTNTTSRAIFNLTKAPLRLAIIQQLQVLLFEEESLLSAEMLATVGIIFRLVRKCDRFRGGVLLIGTDPCQLRPVDGSPLWISHHMISSFDIVKMKPMITIPRTRTPTAEQSEQFETIITRRCIPRNSVLLAGRPSRSLENRRHQSSV